MKTHVVRSPIGLALLALLASCGDPAAVTNGSDDLAARSSGSGDLTPYTVCDSVAPEFFAKPGGSKSPFKLGNGEFVLRRNGFGSNGFLPVVSAGSGQQLWIRITGAPQPTLCPAEQEMRRVCSGKTLAFSANPDLKSTETMKAGTKFALLKDRRGPIKVKNAFRIRRGGSLGWIAESAFRSDAVCNLAPADKSQPTSVATITHGGLTPKSVTFASNGYMFSQNMMYSHNVTMYDRSFKVAGTISDAVTINGKSLRGAPVESSPSHSGRYLWVSNYYMSDAGAEPPDTCTPSQNHKASYVYRMDTETGKIIKAIQVGAVPKIVKASPDSRLVLVSNWCTWTVSVIDTRSNAVVNTIDLKSFGAYPRGIDFDKAGRAYVAMMGGNSIVRIDAPRSDKPKDLKTLAVGSSPRDIVVSKADNTLFATLNGEGSVAKVDLGSFKLVTKKGTSGSQPRSMAISPDGESIYVVNNSSDTMTKMATSDLRILSQKPVPASPIGIAVDPVTRNIWVASYTGSITVFEER